MINDEKIPALIAKDLKMSKSNVSYYIKKAKFNGYLSEITRDAFSVLELTQRGKNFLDQYHKESDSLPICRAENIQFKADILQMPTIPVDWNKIQMHNWTQYTSQIDGIRIKLNTGNSPMLVLLPSPIDGNDPYALFVILVSECMNVMLELYDKIGLKVGRLQLSSRGEWLVYDPIAREFCKTNGQVTYEGIGKVNASRPRSVGEFEFHDPRALTDYLLMPKRIEQIENKVQFLIDLSSQKDLLNHDQSAGINPFATIYCSSSGMLCPISIL